MHLPSASDTILVHLPSGIHGMVASDSLLLYNVLHLTCTSDGSYWCIVSIVIVVHL